MEVTMKTTIRLLCALMLALTGIGWMRVSPAQASTTFNVDTLTDAHDSNTSDGICNNGIDGCSLRAAIEQSFSVSSAGSPVTIHFWSSLSGSTFHLNLGTINWAADSVTLDGETYGITIDGSTFPTAQVLMQISGSHNILTNLTIKNAMGGGIAMGDFAGVGAGSYNHLTNSVIIGANGPGVYVRGSSSAGGEQNEVMNNKIGMKSTFAVGCQTGEGNLEGIYIEKSARNTRVEGNWIGCNGQGILIEGALGAPVQTAIVGNNIGLNQSGPMGNTGNGVLDHLGQSTQISNNFISGNGYGIQFNQSAGGLVTSNMIGVDLSGQNAAPNGDGILITSSTNGVIVGSTTLFSDQNMISGNLWCGVRISEGATNNLLDYNFIGLKNTGTAALPNGKAGVCVINAGVANVIGSNHPDPMQLISGNGEQGIYIENTPRTYVGLTNRIGVAIDGGSPIPNGREGILLNGATNSQITPTSVMHNHGAGIAVIGSGATGNFISFMDNMENGGLPIDLGNDGASLNDAVDADSGPNDLMNYPEITSVSGTSPQVLHGTTCANCQVSLIRAFGSNPAANGGGGSFISYWTADASGNWTATLPAGITRWDVSVISQGVVGSVGRSTSEMSPIYRAFLPLAVR
jgi:hypothetical protein